MMRKFHTKFSEKNLTGNTGLINLGRFSKKLGAPKILSNHLTIERAPKADYQASEVVIMLALGVLLEVKQMKHMAILRTDKILRALFKWDRFPVSTSFGPIFRLFTQKHYKELSDAESVVKNKVWGIPQYGAQSFYKLKTACRGQRTAITNCI